MKKYEIICGIAVCLCLFMMSCTSDVKSELPVIDVIGALKNEKSLKLSEIVDHIEYVKLETTSECLIGGGSVLKVGNNLYVKKFNPAGMLVFDSNGRFIKQISRPGKGPGEYLNFMYFDVSPDNKYLAISGPEDGLKLFTTDGVFKAQAATSSQFFSGFVFQSPEQLITYAPRMNISQKKYPVIVGWDNNLRSDTLLRLDRAQLESDMVFPMVHSASYSYGSCFNFKEADRDTLFQLDSKMKISPRLIFNCGDKAVTEKTLFTSSNPFTIPVYPVSETRDYLFLNAGKGQDYAILAYRKKTGETFRMPVNESRLHEKTKAYGPENDLEGVDFSFNGLKIKGNLWTSILQITDLKTFFETVNPDQLNLKTREYYDELRRLTESSNVNDNPIVRIIYLK
jgi:hypothetical protein